MLVDLHIHTNCSDGLSSPREIVAAAGRLALISICDHDTLRAYALLQRAAPHQQTGASGSTPILPGIEVSARRDDIEVHILGYFARPWHECFHEFVLGLERQRTARIWDGVVQLRNRGIGLRLGVIEALVGDGVPCRSHVSRALVQLGVARNPDVVFRRFLGRETFALPQLDAPAAIEAIRDSGGIAVWAHPDLESVRRHLPVFRAAGLAGLEVHTPRRRSRERRELLELCGRHDLAATGGSDYHGASADENGQTRWGLGRFGILRDDVPPEFWPMCELADYPTGARNPNAADVAQPSPQ
jgi:hypothetical protein